MTLHRIQAPEGAVPAPTPAAPVTTATVASDSNNNANANDPEGATNAENVNGGRNRFAGLRSVTEGLGQMFRGRPAVNCTSPFFSTCPRLNPPRLPKTIRDRNGPLVLPPWPFTVHAFRLPRLPYLALLVLGPANMEECEEGEWEGVRVGVCPGDEWREAGFAAL